MLDTRMSETRDELYYKFILYCKIRTSSVQVSPSACSSICSRVPKENYDNNLVM